MGRAGDRAGCQGAGGALSRPRGRVFRGVPGVPRRHDRQCRLPVDPRLLSRVLDRRVVLGAQRLQHRLRRLPHRLRPADRPAGSPTRVRRRHRAVHPRLGAVRSGALAGVPGRCPRPAGSRCSPAGAGVPGPRRGCLPRRPTGARHRAVGSHCRRRRRPGPTDRRSAGRAGRVALGLLRQHPVRPRGTRRGTAPARRESRAGSSHDARPGRGRRAGRLPGCAEPRHREGQRLGLEQPGRPRLLRGGDRPDNPVRGQQPPSPVAAARPRAAADPLLQPGQRRHGAGGARFLRLPPDEHPVAAVRVGVRRPAGRPGPGAGSARRGGGGRPARPTSRTARLPPVRGARRPGLGRRLSLVPRAGGARAGVLVRVAARPGPQRHRGRCHPPAAGQRRPGRGAGRPLRDRVRCRVQRASAGRRARHRLPRRDRRHPHHGHCPRRAPGRLAALDRRLSRGCGPRPAAGPAHDHDVRGRAG